MSFSINKVIAAGYCGKDPKVEYLPSGVCKASFPLATNETYKDKQGLKVEKTTWHTVQFWGKPAEVIENFVKKGTQLYVEGKIENFSWEKDGEKKYMTVIRGDSFQFVGSAKTANTEGEAVKEQVDNIEPPEDFQDLPF